MPFCLNCGKSIDKGPLCRDCAQSETDTAPVAPVVEAMPDAKPVRFGRRFLREPVEALHEAWVDRRMRPAWVAILWTTVAMALSSFLSDIVRMYLLDLGFTRILVVFGRAALAPVSILFTIFLTVPVFALLVRKATSGQKTSYGRALAGFGAAHMPYAIAMTVYIPVAVAVAALETLAPQSLALSILGYYPMVVVEPMRIGAIVLALFTCRSVAGSTNDGHMATGGIFVLVLQALILAVVGFLVGLLLPPLVV